MQSTTVPLRSVTFVHVSSISYVAPVVVASLPKGLKPISTFAPFVSFKASPVQPLLCQSKPSNAV